MMVDPFQPLDNASGSSGTCENSEILVLQLNMSEDTSNPEKSSSKSASALHDIPNSECNTDAEKTIPNAVRLASDGRQQNDARALSNDERAATTGLMMGGPSSSECETVVLPSASGSECDNLSDGPKAKAHLPGGNSVQPADSLSSEKEWREPDSSTVKNNSADLASEHRASCDTNKTPAAASECDNQQQQRRVHFLRSGITSSSAVILNNSVKNPASPPKSNSSSDDHQTGYSDQHHKLGQVESLQKMDEYHSNSSPTSTTTTEVLPPSASTSVPSSAASSVDNRKVEPLKINLHRDPIILKIPKPPDNSADIVPKITIKPIQKPAAESVETVPKLTIVVDSTSSIANNISNLEAPQEPHIVPKLTIRNATNSSGSGSQSVIVPKLTIKMDNHVATQSNSKDKSLILEDGVKLTIKPVPEPPIPKLTIKTTSDEKAEVLNNTKYSINAGPSSPLTRANIKTSVKPSENVVPKLKIKQILNPDEAMEQGPKFTVSRSDTIAANLNVNCTEAKLVPKLVVRVPKDQDIDAFQIEQKSHSFDMDDVLPKSVLKKIELPELESIPKLTIRQVKDPEQLPEETIVIPKVTIKPIVNPNNESEDSETLVTPKITLKPIPKPIDITQPLEVVTSCTSFKSKLESSDSQQSPRIIIKINKNVSETITKNDQEKDVEQIEHVTAEKKLNQDAQISSTLNVPEKILKRSSCSTLISSSVDVKKQKIDNDTSSWPNTSHYNVAEHADHHKSDCNAMEKDKPTLSMSNSLIITQNEFIPKDVLTRSHSRTKVQIETKACEESEQEITDNSPFTEPVLDSTAEKSVENKPDSISNLELNSNLFPLFCDEKIVSPPHSELDDPSDSSHMLENNLLNLNRNSPSPINQSPNQHTKTTRSSSEVIVVSEGSSSDCIMVEDNNLFSISMTSFNLDQLNKNGHNINKELTVSMESRLDGSRSDTPASKRGRGRPKKGGFTPYSTTPSGLDRSVRRLSSNIPPFNVETTNELLLTNDQISVQNILGPNMTNYADEKPHVETKTTRSSTSKSINAKSQMIEEDQKLKDVSQKIHRTRGYNEALRHDTLTVEPPRKTLTATTITCVTQNESPESNCKVEFNSPLFPLRREENTTAMLHPLLLQDIERAKLLEALMNTNKEVQQSREMLANDLPQSSQTIDMSEDSSSDCILVEDNGSRLLPTDFNSKKENENKVEAEVTIDRDSGVEVSNSLKSLIDATEVDTPTVKRGRGRPKKNTLLAKTDRKQIDLDIVKRKFAGVLMSEHNAKANEILNSVPIGGDIKQDTKEAKPEVRERKRRIRIDDDDESPTFNPLARVVRRGRGRGGRGSRGRGKNRILSRSGSIGLLSSPEKSRDGVLFQTPEGKDWRKGKETVTLQVFEEDTRMSADLLSTPIRNSEFLQNEESQSSILSTASATVESSTTKKRSKIEVADPEGKTEFTVDMIAEYDWPPPKGCCPARNRDTFMIQEQIAEYLGVKSFKRKYQDLPRRTVEMEERNYLLERGMVSEKMCDLGLTAVLASDVLDIMHNDFFEKYEEYKKYVREKHIKDLAAKQKAMQIEAVEKNLSAREHAIRAVSSWNLNFNKSRNDDRRHCLDLQNLVIHLPEEVRRKMSRPVATPSNYPIALVPGQFQEYHRQYNAAELLCYPINTALADPVDLDKKLRDYSKNQNACDSDDSSSSDSDTESSDDSSSDSSETSSDNETRVDNHKCHVCDKPQNTNQDNKPEVFVTCSTCRRKAHPSCIEMPHRMSIRIREYAWQCAECKYCLKCRQKTNEDKILYCDQCDRGYHIYCIGLQVIPTGRWHCSICSICTNCGSRRPEGQRKPNLTNQQYKRLLSTSKWTHEYRINHVSNLREHSATLCVPCTRLNSEKQT